MKSSRELRRRILTTAFVAATVTGLASTASAGPGSQERTVTVIIESLSPANGSALTPVWVAFHDGTFDSYDGGAPSSVELERLAEDGNTQPISDAFTASGAGTEQGTILSDTGIPPIEPGETATMTFTVDARSSRYFSYAAMVLPSNDAFIANGNPLAHRIFDRRGRFLGADFLVFGDETNDAGTELNDEAPENTAFFGQATPNTGQDEAVVIHDHVGFKFPGSGGILDDPAFANGDFLAEGYLIARIRVVLEDAPGGGDDDDDDGDDGDDDDDD